MSLLSRRKINFDDSSGPVSGPVSGQTDGKKKNGQKKQKKVNQPRPFKISETALNCPLFGSSELDASGTSNFLTSLSDPLFPSVKGTSVSSTAATSVGKSKSVVEAVLASSKLSTLSDDRPIEAAPKLGKRKLKAAKKLAKSLTKGSAWFNMSKAEITKEKKNDLEALKMRSATERVLHYKRNHMTHTPKYFHVGTVVETSADFYSSRIPKKQRKKTLAQEFAAEYSTEYS